MDGLALLEVFENERHLLDFSGSAADRKFFGVLTVGRVGAEFIEVFGGEPVGIEVTFEFGAVSQDFRCRLGFEVEDRPRFQNSVRAESGTVGVFRLEAVAILVRGSQAGDVSADRRRRAFGVGQRLFAGDARPRVEPLRLRRLSRRSR